jgi:hypothetical protein
MPHMHPGRDKHGAGEEPVRRVILLTWMATVLVGHFMMDALKELGDTDELSCRETLCQEVIARYEDEARPLIHELKKVKDELVEIWRKQNKPLSLLSEEQRMNAVSRQVEVHSFFDLSYKSRNI